MFDTRIVLGGAPYKFKGQTLFNTIDKDLIDLVVVRED